MTIDTTTTTGIASDPHRLCTVRDGHVYVTMSTGITIECLPYFNELMIAGSALSFPEKPVPPSYMLKDADGDQYEVPYTQEVIDDKITPDEDRVLWAQYLQEQEQYESELAALTRQKNLMQIKLLAFKATRLIDVDLDAWAREMSELYGISISDDPRDRLLEFFSTEVVKGQLDSAKLFAGCARASGMTDAQLDAIEEHFRDSVGW